MASPSIELNFVEPRNASTSAEPVTPNDASPVVGEGISQSLPPVDGGKQAWSFLAGCFILDGIAWGLPNSFGVFQVYYTTHEPFANGDTENTGIAAVGTTCTGIALLLFPILGIAMQRWPHTRRPAMLCGLSIAALALVAASFCNSVLYGVGFVMLYVPGTLFTNEWFVKRKALAYGVAWSGTGTSGAIVPFVLQWLLDSYGFRSALRIWAVALVLLGLPVLYLVRPRLPPSRATAFRPNDLSFMKHFPFWIYQFGVITQSLCANLPILWMPAFAAVIGLPAYAGPLSVALCNGGVAIGTVVLGHFVDRYHVAIAILVCSIGSVIAALVFWGFANSAALLFIFALIWGFFYGGFYATWTGCAGELRRAEQSSHVDTGIVIGLMCASKGVGSLISGPLSASLLKSGWGHMHSRFAYGTNYGVLVVFCGVCAAFGGVGCVRPLTKRIWSQTRP